MNRQYRIVKSIKYARVSEVTSFLASPSGRVIIQANWNDLDIIHGSETYELSDSQTKSGKQFKVDFSTGLKSELVENALVIVSVTFDDDETLILGDKAIPVKLNIKSDKNKNFLSFSHLNWHSPYKLQI